MDDPFIRMMLLEAWLKGKTPQEIKSELQGLGVEIPFSMIVEYFQDLEECLKAKIQMVEVME